MENKTETEKKLYARAHEKIEELLPMLKGEVLDRERWYSLLNISPYNPEHIPYKKAVNLVLWNLSTANIKKKITKNGKGFKVVDDTLIEIDFKSERPDNIFELALPFGIHNHCYLYSKNIMVILGSKDAGKTAVMLNIIRMNMHKHNTIYFSSEMGRSELRKRLSKCEELGINDWDFKSFERSYDFDQVVDPDALNLIDYLELGGDEMEYYQAVSLIRKIYDQLHNGVAIIALQKNRDAELPKGGSGALEKSRIALSLDPNKAKLVVAKNWADGIITSPKGLEWTYQLVGGINLFNIQQV